MAIHHFGRQAERHAELAHLVLEQVAQRLQQLQAQLLGQAADVVVALDRHGLLALGAAGLDHVGIDGALRQPLRALGSRAGEPGRFLLEDGDELAADDLALGLRIAHAGQLAEEQLARVDADHPGVQLADEHVHHHVALVQAQQAVVDEHAGQLVADGAMDQRRSHRGVDAAREAEDDLLVAHLLADRLDRLGDVVAHHPVGPGAADTEHEALEDRLALLRVRDFGMELQRVEMPVFVGHAGDRAALGRSHELEARRQLGDLVAVAHPDVEHAVAFVRREVGDVAQAARCGRARAPPQSRTRACGRPRPCRPAGAPWSACRSRCPSTGTPSSNTAWGALSVVSS